MRISDWSSDVCSSDLRNPAAEIAIGNLAFVDPPIDEMAHELEVGELAERPERLLGGRHGLGEFGHVLGAIIDVRPIAARLPIVRSEERRVGKECVSTCRSRGSLYH